MLTLSGLLGILQYQQDAQDRQESNKNLAASCGHSTQMRMMWPIMVLTFSSL
ncbi:hypothetical protein KUH03_31215 [Sphingobacterium sp. E70]|uniref:hypothetical protein n=1 Tax=Sphingobacterium sp. E70 TaxID=2853439 RepID=UPI00211BB764|nr:hypothetical protein [Sphingobacterium sp. E70]ULT23606.1 hypothetical protein KUH03_31215 [Sphingobacterium sp. E70]